MSSKIVARHHLRAHVYDGVAAVELPCLTLWGVQLPVSMPSVSGFLMGIALAICFMQTQMLHLKFPELQRSRFHQIKARVLSSLMSAIPASACCVLLYTLLMRRHLTIMEVKAHGQAAMCLSFALRL
jgi:hypothetical protein